MAQELSPGDRVSWSTSQGRTRGEVERKQESDFTFADQTFRASKDDPVFVVKSESTGAEAAHHRKALRKLPKH